MRAVAGAGRRKDPKRVVNGVQPEQILDLGNHATVFGLMAVAIAVLAYGNVKGWYVTGREFKRATDDLKQQLEDERERHALTRQEKDEWKDLVIGTTAIGYAAAHERHPDLPPPPPTLPALSHGSGIASSAAKSRRGQRRADGEQS